MTENLTLDKEALFKEIVDRGRKEGVVERETYGEFVETVIQEHLNVGEVDDAMPLPGIIEHLQGRWPDYQRELEI